MSPAPDREDPPAREDLRRQLCAARITGDVATSREHNLRNYRRFVDGDPEVTFGLSTARAWTDADVLAVMVRRCGVSPDPAHTAGPDTIDPERTLEGLDALADRLAAAAAARARVIVATGHPAGLLPVHLGVAAALRRAGCTLLTPAAGWRYEERRRERALPREIRYVAGVAMVSGRGELNHTHSHRPMGAMLGALTEAGAQPPDLVVGDHGWSGAAGEAGVAAVGFADSNDPGLFIGQEEGKIAVTVPLDDNVSPHLYEPLTAYVLDRAGL